MQRNHPIYTNFNYQFLHEEWSNIQTVSSQKLFGGDKKKLAEVKLAKGHLTK